MNDIQDHLPNQQIVKVEQRLVVIRPPVQFVEPKKFEHTVLLSVLSYVGPLVVIPALVVHHDDKFLKFHLGQGLVLVSMEIIILVLRIVLDLGIFYLIVHIAIIFLSLIGVINAVQEKKRVLPIVGGLGKYFSIFF